VAPMAAAMVAAGVRIPSSVCGEGRDQSRPPLLTLQTWSLPHVFITSPSDAGFGGVSVSAGAGIAVVTFEESRPASANQTSGSAHA
jgi:hypothetical protein